MNNSWNKEVLGDEKKRWNWIQWDLENACVLDLKKGADDW